ncbi:tigger transposable element-derived protein 6-like [Montipora foliosa]|uniref:tigger transposable element-derived protein 6-like n=1 Tax=Montipora foliosa TaxID=591990 RepID=UPI0035F1833F
MTILFAAGWRESKNSPWDMPHRISGMDESGAFWKSLKEKIKRCRGGKQAKQRVTVTFFVNAAGEKEPLIVIGTSKTPRCFRKFRDQSRPAGCYYFANSKAWIQSELILQILNTRMKNAGRNIIRFLDNAPSHPRELINMFSNIKVAFRPKNTTSRTQCLHAGVIKNWKVKFRKKLLQYVCSQTGRTNVHKKANDIVKSIDLLKAIRWMEQAWQEVDPLTIVKCWSKVGINCSDEGCEEDDDPFAGEELLTLERLLNQVQDPTNEGPATD